MRYKTVSSYSFLAYVNQGCNVLINLAFIRLLSLHLLGEVAIAKVWMQLVDYSHLGFRFALDRYVPVWGKDKSQNLFWLCIVTSTLVSSIIIGITLLFTSNVLLMCSFVLWGYCISIATILKNYHRALGDDRKMLYVYAIAPTVPVMIQAIAVLLFGFVPFLALTIVSYSCAVLYLFRGTNVIQSLRQLDVKRTVGSVRSSVVYLLLNAIVVFLSFSVDRILLNHFGGKVVLGEYSIILFGFSLLLIVPSTLAEFVFPKIVSRAAATRQIFFPTEMLSVFLPTVVAVVIACIAVPFAVTLLTDYARLVGLIQLVTLGILPYAISPVLFHVMSALDLRRELLVAACVALGIYIALLVYGGFYSSHLLSFFTAARVAYGYVLVIAYGFFLLMHKRARP